MSLTVELVGGPLDGHTQALREVRTIVIHGPLSPGLPVRILGEYRLGRRGDRSFMDWFPSKQPDAAP